MPSTSRPRRRQRAVVVFGKAWIGMRIPGDRWHHCAMHRLQRPNPARAHDRWWRAALLVVAVLLAHAGVLQLAARQPGAAVARAPALEVRRVMVPVEPGRQEPAVTTTQQRAP